MPEPGPCTSTGNAVGSCTRASTSNEPTAASVWAACWAFDSTATEAPCLTTSTMNPTDQSPSRICRPASTTLPSLSIGPFRSRCAVALNPRRSRRKAMKATRAMGRPRTPSRRRRGCLCRCCPLDPYLPRQNLDHPIKASRIILPFYTPNGLSLNLRLSFHEFFADSVNVILYDQGEVSTF